MKPMGFVLRWHYDPQDQGKWKWYKMVELEANGAYKQSRYEKIGWTVCISCPTVKALLCKPASWPNTIHDIDPYDTHMDKKNERISWLIYMPM